MQLLRGLRLNCFLAALVPCLLACIALGYQQYQHQQELLAAHAGEALHSLSSYAQLLANPQTRAGHLHAIQDADRRWQALAIVTLDEEHHLQVHQLIGQDHTLEADNPHPSLIKSQIASQTWSLPGLQMALATPLRYQDGDLGVLYAEMAVPGATKKTALLLIIAATLFTGLLIACYLSRRIYKPIEYLCDEAEAIMHGGTSSATARHSTETAQVASSINDLILKFQGGASSSASLSATESQSDPPHE